MESDKKLPMAAIVMKLIGPVSPVGSTHADNERFANLETMLELMDKMLFEVDQIAMHNAHRHEYSMKRAGERCAKFLDDCGIKE